MGYFSWITSDTKKSISNNMSCRGPLPVYLLMPNNDYLYEDNYEGYGIFAGQDAYALLARWNRPDSCNGDDEHDRKIGINLEFGQMLSNNPNALKYPLKFVENIEDAIYDELKPSETDPDQGYFYDDEDYYEDN